MKIWNFLVVMAGALSASAQPFTITSAMLSNDVLQISFPARADSYYFLHSDTSLTAPSPPVSALLGKVGGLAFNSSVTGTARFFQIEQIPLSSTNSLLSDGIPDGWKLQNGLNPFDPSVTNEVPFGDTRTWLQIYKAEAGLPLAYFPVSSTTVVAGATNVTLQIAFTKPFSGTLNYRLGGTAIPYNGGIGDYVMPPGSVSVANSTTATITINLTPSPAVEINRTLLVALSASSSNAVYTISTNSVAAVRILQSSQGIFVGDLTITNGLHFGAQSVKMAIRPGPGNTTMAFFDFASNPLLGNSFSVPITAGTNGFQLSGASYTNQISNTPWGRSLSFNLSFGATRANQTVFTTPFALSIAGLTGSGLPYVGYGNLNLSQMH